MKDDNNGKGQRVSFAKASEYQKAKAKGEGLSFAMMLIITLAGIAIARRVQVKRKMVLGLAKG
ncbi:MAG: hypothetical protein HZA06_01255 [Nitrospirae bacterium]|nr:hypothetical protein [Nitrospirota bacterium]